MQAYLALETPMHCTCPSCGQAVVQDANTMGRLVSCPSCGSEFVVPWWGRSLRKGPLVWSFGVLFVLALVALAMINRSGTSRAGTRLASDPLQGAERALSETADSSHSPPRGQRDNAQRVEGRGSEKPASHSGRQLPAHGDTSNPTNGRTPTAALLIAQGGQLYRDGRYHQACDAFRMAIALDGENPLTHYLLALSLYQAGDVEAAERSAQQGIAWERQYPIDNWGQLLARYQGHARLWLEQLRRDALGSASP